MSHQHDSSQDLLDLIRERRASIQGFVSRAGPRSQRLMVVSIFSSSIVSALTAGPALGGTRFTEAAAAMARTGDDSIVWRGLCLSAMILSILAAISTNMLRSSETATRVAKAEACNAALEGLE